MKIFTQILIDIQHTLPPPYVKQGFPYSTELMNRDHLPLFTLGILKGHDNCLHWSTPKTLSWNLMVPQLPISLSEISLKSGLSLPNFHHRNPGKQLTIVWSHSIKHKSSEKVPFLDTQIKHLLSTLCPTSMWSHFSSLAVYDPTPPQNYTSSLYSYIKHIFLSISLGFYNCQWAGVTAFRYLAGLIVSHSHMLLLKFRGLSSQ